MVILYLSIIVLIALFVVQAKVSHDPPIFVESDSEGNNVVIDNSEFNDQQFSVQFYNMLDQKV